MASIVRNAILVASAACALVSAENAAHAQACSPLNTSNFAGLKAGGCIQGGVSTDATGVATTRLNGNGNTDDPPKTPAEFEPASKDLEVKIPAGAQVVKVYLTLYSKFLAGFASDPAQAVKLNHVLLSSAPQVDGDPASSRYLVYDVTNGFGITGSGKYSIEERGDADPFYRGSTNARLAGLAGEQIVVVYRDLNHPQFRHISYQPTFAVTSPASPTVLFDVTGIPTCGGAPKNAVISFSEMFECSNEQNGKLEFKPGNAASFTTLSTTVGGRDDGAPGFVSAGTTVGTVQSCGPNTDFNSLITSGSFGYDNDNKLVGLSGDSPTAEPTTGISDDSRLSDELFATGMLDTSGKLNVRFTGDGDQIITATLIAIDINDADCDGILDAVDNCPTTVNPNQEDGNVNQIGDACDCGDGMRVAGEACDDGNTANGDGCSNTCRIDNGFTCDGAMPDVCTPICGDGMVLGGEPCDDGNTANGDGCSSQCDVEPGYTCIGSPSVCTGEGVFAADTSVSGGGCTTGTPGAGGLLCLLAGLFGLVMLKKKRPSSITRTLLALTLWLAAGTKLADAQGIQSEFPAERFELSPNRLGILDVDSGQVLGHLNLDVGLWAGYADDPLVLNNSTGRIGSLVHSRLGGALVGSIGLGSRFELGLSAPLVFSQSQRAQGVQGAPASIDSFGFADITAIPKLQLLRGKVALALGVAVSLPSATSADYFGNKGVAVSPQLALSGTGRRFRAALNLGYTARKRQVVADLDVDDELYGHVGVGFKLTPELELMGTFGLATLAKAPLRPYNNNYSEAKLGLGYAVSKRVQLFAAGGFGTSEGFGTPDWRALGGVWIGTDRGMRARTDGDRDHDGIRDSVDKCPDVAETVNGIEDEDGCPEVDTDGDGLIDPQDKCPNEPGPKSNQGCPVPPEGDKDGDGLVDSIDKCPDDPEDKDGFQDDDGCPDPDNDGDGVVDAADKCRDLAGPVENRGCPDSDRDKDSVVDRLDNCPDEFGTVANHGCKEKQSVTITATGFEITDSVYFKTDKAVIESRSFGLLRNVAAVIKNHPEVTAVVVEGHTDNQGSAAHNKDLSQRRAEAVMLFLTQNGVDRARLRAAGFGPDRPIMDNRTKAGRAANRRVEFRIDGAKGDIRDGGAPPPAE